MVIKYEDSDKLIDGAKLEEILGLSRSSIVRLRKDGMPHLKVGKRSIKYNLDRVMKWLEERQ